VTVLPLAGVPAAMVEADERGNLSDTAFVEWLRAHCRKERYTLVILDPLSRFAGADAETDNAAATRFVQAVESVATECGATILIAHHVNKSARGAGAPVSGASARGSTAIFDGVRWVAALSGERVEHEAREENERLGEIVTLTVVKSNYSAKGDPVQLRRDVGNGGALLPLDELDLQLVGEARRNANPKVQREAERSERSRERTSEVAEAVRALLVGSGTGLTYRELYAQVKASLRGCGRQKLDEAIVLLGSTVITKPGPRNSVLHCVCEVQQ
jgi:RecA-family ATPase